MAELNFYLFDKLKQFNHIRFIIWRRNNKPDVIYTYEEILVSCKNVVRILKENNIPSASRISIKLSNGTPSICVVILGILNHFCVFCPISEDSSEDQSKDSMHRYRSTHIFVNHPFVNADFNLYQSFSLFEETIFLYYNNKGEQTFEKIPGHCYSVQTSGTTGIQKVVHVPYSCILPNIEGLSSIFKISCNDVIFLGAPSTFDPFVIELFLALKNGSSLLLVSNSIRVLPSLLAEKLFPDQGPGATIIQMTPSNFINFGDRIIEDRIINTSSYLRILILGGEVCPYLKKLKYWLSSEKHLLHIYNIYGITEISCWTTIHKILPNFSEYIPLGKPIDDSMILHVRNEKNEIVSYGEGELFLGSNKRVCLVDEERIERLSCTHPVFRPTGDLVEFVNKDLVFKGRLNDIVKRFGYRTNLKKIENSINNIDGVLNSAAIFITEDNLLILFIITENNASGKNILENLPNYLEKNERPDIVEIVNKFPQSSHGKVSKPALMKLFKESRVKKTPLEVFERFLANVFGQQLENTSKPSKLFPKRHKSILDLSFLQAGGTSFQALTLVTEMEKTSNTPLPSILEMMLSSNFTIHSIIESLQATICIPKMPAIKKIMICQLVIQWSYDTEKCVDAAPTIISNGLNTIVSIGSHSHKVFNLNIFSGDLVSLIKLPDRIESQVRFIENSRTEIHGYVGCYDGLLYKFNPLSGTIICKLQTNGMIKTQPLIIGSLVIVGNYSNEHNVLAFTGTNLMWSLKLGKKGIFSSPIQLDTESVLVSTLDGTIARINYQTGDIIWIRQLSSPIFSKCVSCENNTILIAEVKGLVNCFDYNGNQLWNFRTNGTIFSSFAVQNVKEQIYIVFGCHDNNLYCLQKDPFEKEPILFWKIELGSQIFSTPKIFKESFIIACCIIGEIYLIKLNNGGILGSIKLNGEVFSTPSILNNRIIVGCRDNSVYCIQISNLI